MNPREPDSTRFAQASAPVNRRTAAARRLTHPEPPKLLNPTLRQRLARKNTQHLLGISMKQSLAIPEVPRATSSAKVVLALGLAVSGVGLLLAGVQASWSLAGAAAGLGMTAAAMYGWSHRHRAPSFVSDLPTAFDEQTVATLDSVMNHIAPELTPALLEQLRALKGSLIRMAPRLSITPINEHFTQDGRHYLQELVRRYLPDSLQAYLRIPQDLRLREDAQGHTAAALLAEQLHLLQNELTRREAKLALASRDELERQQRFLQAKQGE